MDPSSFVDDLRSPSWMTSSSRDEPDTVVSTPAGLPADAGHPSRGAVVSRYVVLEEVGRGGVGRVLLAYDPKLQREVAIKELHQEALDESAAARMVVEARAMAKLSHPHVVSIYDVEEVDARRVVLVMEYVRGTTLRRWLAAKQRSWSEVVAMLAQAGRGLAAAHEAGLLHRDFKPGNVLVSEDGTAKVMDFGLAKPVGGASSSSSLMPGSSMDVSSELTAAGMVMGTPRYMAPEQHLAETLSPATDQYAFCITLWESLCGKPPFAGATAKDLVLSKLERPPAWPRPDVPRPIVEAIVRGLSPKPEERWPSMEALLGALTWDPSRKRSRVLLGVGAVVVSSAAALSYGAWARSREQPCRGGQQQLAGVWDDERRAQVQSAFASVDKPYAQKAWQRTEQALDGYASEWVAMHTEACEATAVRGEQSPQLLDMRMACLHRAAVDLRATVEVLADADAKVVQKAHDLTGELRPLSRCADAEALAAEMEPPKPAEAKAVEAARTRLAEANTRIKAGRYSEAKAAVEQARRLLEGLEYGPVQTELALAEGRLLERLGDYAAAETVLERALRLATRWGQRESMRVAVMRLMLVVGDRRMRMEEALRYRPLAEGLVEGDPEAEAGFRNGLGLILTDQGKYAEAEAELRAAKAAWEAALGPDHTDVARSRNNLGNVLHAQGKLAEAEVEHRAALASMEAALGSDHPDVASLHNNLGNDLHAQGKHAEAEAEHRAALASSEASLDPGHPDVAMSRNNLGNVLHDQGKEAEAEVEHRAALASRQASMGPDHPDVAQSRNNLADVLRAQGKHAEAAVELRAALVALEAALGPEHPDLVQSHINLASVLLELERPTEALPLAEQVWARCQQDDIPLERRARAALVLARAQWQVAGAKDPERARSLARARGLAEAALRTYLAAGDAHRDDADDVRAWLAEHPAG